MLKLRWTAALLAALGMFGCGEREADFTTNHQYLAPVALDRDVALIDQTAANVLLVDAAPATASASARVSSLPTTSPILAELRRGSRDRSELLVLCQGNSDNAEGGARPAELAVIADSGLVRSYRLAAQFNALAQSDDGRYALLYFDASKQNTLSDSLLFNPLQIAIVDLETTAEPLDRTLDGAGSVPTGVVFSPAMTLAGESRRLAVVLMNSTVNVIDLTAPERPITTVTVSTDRARNIELEQVLFDEVDNKIYLRGSGLDIYVLQLTPDPSESDFETSLNQLGASGAPKDMVLYAAGPEAAEADAVERRRVLAVGGMEALVIDADSNRVTSIGLGHAASKIHLFQWRPDLESEATRGSALLYQLNTNVISFLDLEDVEDRRTRNLERLTLRTQYTQVIDLRDNLLLFIHGSSGLSLIDLAARTVSEISSRANLQGAVYDPALGRLWVKPQGDERLGFVDIGVQGDSQSRTRTFVPNEVRLDAPIDQLLPMTRLSPERLVVTHASAVGWLTILDARDPANLERAVSLRGYTLQSRIED